MRRAPLVSGILITPKGRVLVIRREREGMPIYRTLPGAPIEPGDGTAEGTLRREVREETGAVPTDLRLVAVLDIPAVEPWIPTQTHYVFIGRVEGFVRGAAPPPAAGRAGKGEIFLEELDLTPEALASANVLPPETSRLLTANAADLWSLPAVPPAQNLVAEQVAYYSAVAGIYANWANVTHPALAIVTATLEAMVPHGHVLEIACGPGLWTERLARVAKHVTALDASLAMLDECRTRVTAPNVETVLADIFEWEPTRTHDAVTFAFWHSHVPPERWGAYWAKVDRALAPGGRVLFIDNAPTEPVPHEVILDSASSLRWGDDGKPYRIVKVYHQPADLERRLRAIGWDIEVSVTGPILWAHGGRR